MLASLIVLTQFFHGNAAKASSGLSKSQLIFHMMINNTKVKLLPENRLATQGPTCFPGRFFRLIGCVNTRTPSRNRYKGCLIYSLTLMFLILSNSVARILKLPRSLFARGATSIFQRGGGVQKKNSILHSGTDPENFGGVDEIVNQVES